jgi:hypothetical protein
MKPGTRRFILTLVVILVCLYMIGGMRGVRRLRARLRAWTTPPTAAEMQRPAPVPDTLPSLPKAVTRTPDGRKIPMSEPPSAAAITVVIAGVLGVAVLLMFATGRDRQGSHESSRP